MKHLDSDVLERCVWEVERRLSWVRIRREIVTTLCQQVCDEDRGPIAVDHSGYESDPFVHWSDLNPEPDPERWLETLARGADFVGDGVTGPMEPDEVDELLAGMALALHLDQEEIERTVSAHEVSTRGASLAAMAHGVEWADRVAVLEGLTRLTPRAPLVVHGAIEPLGFQIYEGFPAVADGWVTPRARACEWAERLAQRPMRRLEAPSLVAIAPWMKGADEAWTDRELVASLLRELALRSSLQTARDAERDCLRHDEQRALDAAGERVEVFSRRLDAARKERAARIARSPGLGLTRLVREHDLSEPETEVLLVVAALSLLDDDASIALEVGRRRLTGRRMTWPGTVEGVSALMAHARAKRMAIRELLRRDGRLVGAGLVALASPHAPSEDELLDPSTDLSLTPYAAAVLTGLPALVEAAVEPPH